MILLRTITQAHTYSSYTSDSTQHNHQNTHIYHIVRRCYQYTSLRYSHTACTTAILLNTATKHSNIPHMLTISLICLAQALTYYSNSNDFTQHHLSSIHTQLSQQRFYSTLSPHTHTYLTFRRCYPYASLRYSHTAHTTAILLSTNTKHSHIPHMPTISLIRLTQALIYTNRHPMA